MTKVAFEKWEGLGNDFVLIGVAPGDATAASSDLARALCDRRHGIGADGVIAVTSAGRGFSMVVHNADGSRPEMCGNGIRCVAGYLVERAGAGAAFSVETDAGPRTCRVERRAPGAVDVIVEMGVAVLGSPLVVDVEGRPWRFATASVGNPHAITFEPTDDAAIDRVGPAVARAPSGGTNVEFCRATPDGIDVVVWERGVGRTLACGTGACAVAAVACAEGRATYGEPVRVRLPGGTLAVRVDEATRAVEMRGPARRVYLGEVVLP